MPNSCIGLMFADGTRMLRAEMRDQNAPLPEAGQEVELEERSLHQRTHEYCTKPNCPCRVEPLKMYRVVAVRSFTIGSMPTQNASCDPLDQVIRDRPWEELSCPDPDCSDMFDSYSLTSRLGVELGSDVSEPATIYVVDVTAV